MCNPFSDHHFKKTPSQLEITLHFLFNSTNMSSTTTPPPTPTILPYGTKPVNYQVTLDINLNECVYTFDTKISFILAPNTSTIRLHWIPKKDDSIKKVEFATFTTTSGKTHTSNNTLVEEETQTILFTFDEVLPEIGGILHISGSSLLDDSLCGLYRSKYTDPHTKQLKYMAVTQFEATDARRCFPCVDEPAAKATFELTAIVDRSYDVVSNMPLSERKSLNERRVSISFPKSPIMSTYLVALIVGEFDVISTLSSNGVRTSIFTPRGQSHLGKHALHVASLALPFFEKEFGIQYPLPKSDLLAIPDFAAGKLSRGTHS